MLVCSHPCSAVAASAEPPRAAVVLRPANLVVVNPPLPVRAAGRRSSTSERSRPNRHHAASRAVAARPNQAAVHLPLRHVLQNAERTAEHVLLLVPLKVQTVPLPVQASVLQPVHQKQLTVLLHVHQPVLQLADQRLQVAPLHVHLHVDLRAQLVLLPVAQREPTVLLHVHRNVHQPADQKVQTVPHHVRQSVLLPVVLREPTVLLRVQKHVVLSVVQAVLQPAVPKVPAAATIVAVQTLAKSLS